MGHWNTRTFPPKCTHRLFVKPEYIGVNERQNTCHMWIGTKQRFVLLQKRHVLSNLAVSIKNQFKRIRPCACSLTDLRISVAFLNASKRRIGGRIVIVCITSREVA